MFRRFAVLFLTAMLVVSSFAISACATPQHEEMAITMAGMDTMPMQVQRQSHRVSQAYRFAAANAEILQHMPCYCGCGPIGHKNNYDCYVAGIDPAGVVVFDPHALGCQICVDITQDAMRFTREGRSLLSLQQHVDRSYSRYGPTNLVQ